MKISKRSLKLSNPGRSMVLRALLLLTGMVFAFSAPGTLARALCGQSGGGFTGSGFMPINSSFDLSRSAFNERGIRGKRVKYCVLVDGQPKKINQSRLRSFRGAYLDDFALALVDCGNPTQLALAQVEPKKIPQVLAYLSQHYRLRLTQLSSEERLAKRQALDRGPVVASAK